MLRICVAEGDVTTRRIVGREGEYKIVARAVVDARGLEEESVWRVEEDWEIFGRGQVAREVDVRKRGDGDQRGEQERENHPRAEESITSAGFIFVPPFNTTLAPRAQDRDGGRHGASIQGDRETSKQVERKQGKKLTLSLDQIPQPFHQATRFFFGQVAADFAVHPVDQQQMLAPAEWEFGYPHREEGEAERFDRHVCRRG